MIEWVCTMCGHVDFADSQLDRALQILTHYTVEHPAEVAARGADGL